MQHLAGFHSIILTSEGLSRLINLICWFGGSHIGDYEEVYLLEYKAMSSLTLKLEMILSRDYRWVLHW
jgi:hypothetical protein